MKGNFAERTYLRELEGLGRLICIFKKNTEFIEQGEYYVDKYFELNI